MQALLAARGLDAPDGRPLYGYRFTRAEYEWLRDHLRAEGARALHERHGRALIVAYVAEWFRREREGGHWDWIRPLRSIGHRYGQYDVVRYRDVEDVVRSGLSTWRRPQPHDGERLLSVVREAGFPVAAVREDPRIASWIRHAVASSERGFPARDAVEAEAWRISDGLALALFEPAIELCEALVALRASLGSDGSPGDPVERLDRDRPGWREGLPFEIENDDLRSMVEQIVRMRADGTAALDLTRRMVAKDGGWEARASLGLSGAIDPKRLPPEVAAALIDGRRVRIGPRPPLPGDVPALAAIETFERDGVLVHEVRAFVAEFDCPLPLGAEARFSAQIGNAVISEFVALGGTAIAGPAVALEIESVDESGQPSQLRVLGLSPAASKHASLVLAIEEPHFEAITFSAGFRDIGQCLSSGRRLVVFEGSARLVLDGVGWTWRTSADRPVDARLVLMGTLVPRVRETIYLGLPEVFVERDGGISRVPTRTIYWKPRGRGRWRPVAGDRPYGAIDLAVLDGNEMRYSTAASIVPADFSMALDRIVRRLILSGLSGASVAANGQLRLERSNSGAHVSIDLAPPGRSAHVELRLRWEAELAATIVDPTFHLRAVDGNDQPLAPRAVLCVDGLAGIRLLASDAVTLCFTLRAPDAPPIGVTRSAAGEIPLVAFADIISHLLGSSERLDARVVVSAVGAGESIVEVKWYAEDVDPFVAPRDGAFAVLATTWGLDLRAIALAHPSAGTVAVDAPAAMETIRRALMAALPGGPWLIFGRRRSGAKVRPRVVPSILRPPSTASLLERAIGTDASSLRSAAFMGAYSQPDQIGPDDRRTIVDLLGLARREGLPVSSIDALKELDRAPALAVLLLASCDRIEERSALLGLQRDLPFLWATTTIADWLTAFEARLGQMQQRLLALEMDAALAHRTCVGALADVVSQRPELAGHAKAVFLVLLATGMASAGKEIDASELNFLRIPNDLDGRRRADRMITRHDGTDPPPHGMMSAEARNHHVGRWSPYDDRFADLIVTPFAIADHVTGRTALGQDRLRRCREAWLYDPEYFEETVPIAIDLALRGTVERGSIS